jgi:hypothetical protein
MSDPYSEQIKAQREAAIEETRNWVRNWDADQRELVLWILEEEVRHDKLLNFTHENGDKNKYELN